MCSSAISDLSAVSGRLSSESKAYKERAKKLSQQVRGLCCGVQGLLLLEVCFPGRFLLLRMRAAALNLKAPVPRACWLVQMRTCHVCVALLMQAFIRKYAPAVVIIVVVLLLLYLRSFFYR